MEFNPLDLLARAAELQQKTKTDGPDIKIMTRQRRANSFPLSNSSDSNNTQKEISNKDVKEINNTKGKNNGVRKYKITVVTSDLEKMLDEHNYGNAKKTYKHERSLDVEKGDSVLNRERTESVLCDSTAEQCSTGDGSGPEGSVRLTDGDSSTGLSWENLSPSERGQPDYNCEQVKLVLDIGDKASGPASDNSGNTSQDVLINSSKDKTMCLNTQENAESLIENTEDSSLVCTDRKKEEKCEELKVEAIEHGSKDEEANMRTVSLTNEVPSGSLNESESDGSTKVRTLLPVSKSLGEKTLVRVISTPVSRSEVMGSIDQPQTLIINISKTGSSNVKSQLSPVSVARHREEQETQVDNANTTEVHPSKTALTIIRSLLTGDRVDLTSGKTNLPSQIRTVCVKQQGNKIDSPIVRKTLSSSHNNSAVLDSSSACSQTDCEVTVNDKDKLEQSDQDLSEEGSPTQSWEGRSSELIENTSVELTEGIDERTYIEKCVLNNGQLKGLHGEAAQTEVCTDPTKLENEKSDFVVETDSNSCTMCMQCKSDDCDTHSPESNNAESLGGVLSQSVCDAENPSEVTEAVRLQCKPCVRDRTKGETTAEGSNLESMVENNNSCDEQEKTECESDIGNTDEKINASQGPEPPVFFTDHCYAGVPGRTPCKSSVGDDNGDPEVLPEEGSTHSACASELSQDSGYGDVTQSPMSETDLSICGGVPGSRNVPLPVIPCVQPTLGETNVLGTLPSIIQGNIIKLSETSTPVDSTSPPAFLAVCKDGRQILVENRARPIVTEPVTFVTRPVTPTDLTNNSGSGRVTPSKYGKFQIGTYASFSNSSMGMEGDSEQATPSLPLKTPSPPNSVLSLLTSPPRKPVLANPVGDGSRTPSPKSATLSPDGPTEVLDHIQHDHDYCTHSLLPLFLTGSVEARLNYAKSRSIQSGKGKKGESDSQKMDRYKRGKKSVNVKVKSEFLNCEGLGMDTCSQDPLSPTSSLVRQKSRGDKLIEVAKSSEPKMKITGSSNFQDQFVYSLNTKLRSRRRESRDIPLPVPVDKVLLPPPKPGDIVVPHLTDADIEALKSKSRPAGKISGILRRDGPFTKSPLLTSVASVNIGNGLSTTIAQSDPNIDDESKIINTILSMETDSMQTSAADSFDQSYTETVENTSVFNQGPELMNLTPEQMNLTPEQMDLLFSAVEEVQNSSPGLVDSSEKPGLSVSPDPTFGQFPSTSAESDSVEENVPGDQKVDDVETSTATAPSLTPDSPAAPSGGQVESNLSKPDVAEESGTSEKSAPATISGADLPSEDVGVKESNPAEASTVKIQYDANSNIKTEEEKKSPTPPPQLEHRTPFIGAPDPLDSGSSSPIKSLLQSTPSTTSATLTNNLTPDLSFPSLDKSSLDLLGNEFKLFPEAVVAPSTSTPSSVSSSASSLELSSTVPTDYSSSPWIVTVSMYWNDLPAIMMNNVPFVRLVDIHKQILPAKDTGILKKRCQLLGIAVENCTEMQRYFLVQYGRAFNSKSTLIVSKDDAKVLIGYYVEPPPKMPVLHRPEVEYHRETPRKRSGSRERKSKLNEVTPAKVKASERVEESSPVQKLLEVKVQPSPAPVEPVPSVVPATVSPTLPPTPVPNPRLQRSTRHKKINFLELLRGDTNANDVAADEVVKKIPDGIKSSSKSLKRCRGSTESLDRGQKKGKMVKSRQEEKRSRRSKLEEETESEGDEDEETDEESSEESSDAESDSSTTTCEISTDGSYEESESETDDPDIIMVKKIVKPAVVSTRQNKIHSKTQTGQRRKQTRGKNSPLKVKIGNFSGKGKTPKKGLLFTNTEPTVRPPVKEVKIQPIVVEDDVEPENTIRVQHKDSNTKNGHRSGIQAGEMYLDKYSSKKATCIRCLNCNKFLSVDNFMKHLHDFNNGNGNLLLVSQPQTLEPYESVLSDFDIKIWESFNMKKDMFDNNELPSPDITRVDSTMFSAASEDSCESRVSENADTEMKETVMVSPVMDKEIVTKPVEKNVTKTIEKDVKNVIKNSGGISRPHTNQGVRVSSRKRKEKQLYPFESYTFGRKKPRRQVDLSEDSLNAISEESSWSKGENSNQNSVVTIANGPELTSFTALQEDLEV